jgi:hypothetical protein
VLVGGGKDSIVTLTLLQHLKDSSTSLSSLALNPIPASIQAIEKSGYPTPLIVQRKLDPQIATLNAQGYLNGHTPFSALLAFASVLVAYQHGIQNVLASNESSASEGNVTFHNFEINHQYSKGIEFEAQFRALMEQMNIPVRYLSFLRPINELQICGLFSRMPEQHQIFRSCNREQTQSARLKALDQNAASSSEKRIGWCGECPKCVFTFICLSCFLSKSEMLAIFGMDPSNKPGFASTLRELAGFTEHKPFECVGTYEEVRAALSHLFSKGIIDTKHDENLQELHEHIQRAPHSDLSKLLAKWDEHNFLNDPLASLIKTELSSLRESL